jgi:hypothetical protein
MTIIEMGVAAVNARDMMKAKLLCFVALASFAFLLMLNGVKADTIDYAPNGLVGEEYWGPGTGQSYGMIFTAPQSALAA